jgi:hypothetical protein
VRGAKRQQIHQPVAKESSGDSRRDNELEQAQRKPRIEINPGARRIAITRQVSSVDAIITPNG